MADPTSQSPDEPTVKRRRRSWLDAGAADVSLENESSIAGAVLEIPGAVVSGVQDMGRGLTGLAGKIGIGGDKPAGGEPDNAGGFDASALASGLGDAMSSVGSGLGKAASIAGDGLGLVVETAGSALSSAGEVLASATEVGGTLLSTVGELAGPAAEAAADAAGEIAEGVVSGLGDILSS